MNPEDKITVAVVALGCSKNLVDAECMIAAIREAGYELTDDYTSCDVAVINTCGFIEAAKKEAIDTILDVAEYKKSGDVKHIIVTGCLPQRYSSDILAEMPEVDMVLGTAHYKDICSAIRSLMSDGDADKQLAGGVGGLDHLRTDRYISTEGFAYLKIAEGCLHRCSFCAIPLIRGNYVSRPVEDILAEAEQIAGAGYKEIILAAQDTTNYGIDLYKTRKLPELLSSLSQIEGIETIRIMYGYLDGIDDELLREIRDNGKVAHYLDIPIQHADDTILRAMFRGETNALITEKLAHIREMIPDIILRTTVMVGFPGETDEQFQNLRESLIRWGFDRVGCFIYSPEEGTKAYDMRPFVDEQTASARYNDIYELSKEFTASSNEKRIGTEVTVTIDSVSEDGIFYIGRSYGEAPEVDPVIYVVATKEELIIGERYNVRIVETSDYDMTGVTI